MSVDAVNMDNVDENTCDSLDDINFGMFLRYLFVICLFADRNTCLFNLKCIRLAGIRILFEVEK